MDKYTRVEIHTRHVSVNVYEDGSSDTCVPYHTIQTMPTIPHNGASVVIVGQIQNGAQIERARGILHAENVQHIRFFIEDCLMPTQQFDPQHLGLDAIISRSQPTKYTELDCVVLLGDGFSYDVFHCEYIGGNRLPGYDFNINYFDWFTTFNYTVADSLARHIPSFEFDVNVVCLNNRKSVHRMAAGTYLAGQQQAIVRNNFESDSAFISTARWMQTDTIVSELIDRAPNFVCTELTTNVNTHDSFRDAVELYSRGAVSLVTETRFFSDLPNFTEKTLKAIIAMRPFLIMGPPHTLKLLRSLNFKTFPDIIDERYDDEPNHSVRLNMILTQVDFLMSLPKSEMARRLVRVEETLVHNRNTLRHLRGTALSNLRKASK